MSTVARITENNRCGSCQARDSSVFCHLEEGALAALELEKHTRHHSKGQALFYEGTPVRGVYCTRAGRVKTYKTAPDGRQHILRLYRSGEVLGLHSLFSSGIHSTSAEMLQDGEVCFLPARAVRRLVRDEPALAVEVIRTLATSASQADEERITLAYTPVRERLARLLLSLAEEYGVEESCGGRRIDLDLSREELAGLLGTAPETTIRQLAKLRRERLIELAGREIKIVDRHRLVEEANAVC